MRNLTLLTDLYQLTMGQGYFEHGKRKKEAVFDLFFRPNKLITYSVAAGMEQVCEYLENFHFEPDEIEYLRSLGIFGSDYLDYLKELRFTGSVDAVREGEIVFPYEPILTVRAPMIEAQLVETALLTIVNHQTLIASKAAKICAQMRDFTERARRSSAVAYRLRTCLRVKCLACLLRERWRIAGS